MVSLQMPNLEIIGATLSFYVAILLLKNIQEKAHRVLLVLVLLWGIRFLLYWIKSSGWVTHFPAIVLIDQNLFFLDGPLMWLYVQAINNKKILHWKNSLHFLPFAYFAFQSWHTYLKLGSEQLLAVYKSSGKQLAHGNHSLSLGVLVVVFVIIGSIITYNILSIKELNRYHKKIKNNLSNIEKVQFRWLYRLLLAWALFLTFPIFLFFLNYLSGIGTAVYFELGFILSLCVFVGIVGYYGSNQQYAKLKSIVEQNMPRPAQEKYQKSGLSPAKAKQAYLKFIAKIETEKWYLQEDLSLPQLAALLQVKPNVLSQVINAASNDNFYDFINRFRVAAVKELLPHSGESVLQIAFACGFKSKSTFNACFKKFTGYTPTQYRKLKETVQN